MNSQNVQGLKAEVVSAERVARIEQHLQRAQELIVGTSSAEEYEEALAKESGEGEPAKELGEEELAKEVANWEQAYFARPEEELATWEVCEVGPDDSIEPLMLAECIGWLRYSVQELLEQDEHKQSTRNSLHYLRHHLAFLARYVHDGDGNEYDPIGQELRPVQRAPGAETITS